MLACTSPDYNTKTKLDMRIWITSNLLHFSVLQNFQKFEKHYKNRTTCHFGGIFCQYS